MTAFLISIVLAATPTTGAAPLPIASAVPLATAAGPLRGPAVVVLWASWCASCKAELARLPALARAAAPLPIRTLALDPPERARAVMADRRIDPAAAYADGGDIRTVLDGWGGPGVALPIAVAIDATGHVCGRKLGLLGSDQLKAWAARCR